VWQVLRVTLKTDARNTTSRQAIERLGTRAEGARRVHAPVSDGTVLDTAYWSSASGCSALSTGRAKSPLIQ